MAEVLITEGRTLVGAGILTEEGYIMEDPAGVLDGLRRGEEQLREEILGVNMDYPFMEGVLRWGTAKVGLLWLEGRTEDARGVRMLTREDMLKNFRPRDMVRQVEEALNEGVADG